MEKTSKHPQGSVLTSHCPKPDVEIIKARADLFSYRKRKKMASQLPPPWRGATAWLLSDEFGWTNTDIARFLHCDRKTVASDIRFIDMFRKSVGYLADYIEGLKKYIYHNHRYTVY